jgi:protein-L-isoaspartate(D-aspartate) O-methyltransferase
MTDLLQPEAGQRVLEIGTGSGYQTAVLSRLSTRCTAWNSSPSSAAWPRERLRRLGYHNVETRVGDGHAGWPEQALRRIIVTAAATHIPPALVAQLKPVAGW